MLSQLLKLPSTRVTNIKPKVCPACMCVRFERIERQLLDIAFKREGRYRCSKCTITTLYIRDSPSRSHSNNNSGHEAQSDIAASEMQFRIACKLAREEQNESKAREAFDLFHRAAASGHRRAQYNTAIYLLKAGGWLEERTCDARQSEAKFWLEQAAEQGHDDARALLMRLHGSSVA